MSKDPRWIFDRRLWLILLVALSTAVAILVPSEIFLRARYPAQEYDRCLTRTSGTPHGTPGCVSHSKATEGLWVENRYNECGYRSSATCGPKPPGTVRVAVLGSSTASGWLVPEPATLTGQLPAALTASCERPVETQNLAVEGMPVAGLAASAKEALALDPDALVLVITSYDLDHAVRKPATGRKLARRYIDDFNGAMDGSALFSTARYVALSREADYIAHVHAQDLPGSSLNGDTRAGIDALAVQLDRIAAANTRKIPVLLAFAPNRSEVIVSRLSHKAPQPVDVALRRLAETRGALYTDMLTAIPTDIPTTSLFYVLSYHLNANGLQYLTQAVARRLVTSSSGVFWGCRTVLPAGPHPSHP